MQQIKSCRRPLHRPKKLTSRAYASDRSGVRRLRLRGGREQRTSAATGQVGYSRARRPPLRHRSGPTEPVTDRELGAGLWLKRSAAGICHSYQ